MILVVGESLVDVVERPDGSRTEHPGGSPANVAVGLARLGLQTQLATMLATDDHGALVRMHLAESGVQVVPGLREPDRTATAIARLDAAGSATYTFDLAWDPGRIEPTTSPDAVHTGSIATFLEPGADEVEDALRRLAPTSVVTLDPNLRPDLVPDRAEATARIESLVALSDVVKVSDEDLAFLHPHDDPADVARRWIGHGPVAVAVTFGAHGSRVHTARGSVRLPATAPHVVDTVGAGDSYMAGLIAALDDEAALGPDGRSVLEEADLPFWRRVASVASRAAAITVGRAGAQPPWRDEMVVGD
ncbi:MAG: carbohydrate kinase [Aeromicrobium erythreum]